MDHGDQNSIYTGITDEEFEVRMRSALAQFQQSNSLGLQHHPGQLPALTSPHISEPQAQQTAWQAPMPITQAQQAQEITSGFPKLKKTLSDARVNCKSLNWIVAGEAPSGVIRGHPISFGIYLVESVSWYSKATLGHGELITPHLLENIDREIKRFYVETELEEVQKLVQKTVVQHPRNFRHEDLLRNEVILKINPVTRFITQPGIPNLKPIWFLDTVFRSFQEIGDTLCRYDWAVHEPMNIKALSPMVQWTPLLELKVMRYYDYHSIECKKDWYRDSLQSQAFNRLLMQVKASIQARNLVYSAGALAWDNIIEADYLPVVASVDAAQTYSYCIAAQIYSMFNLQSKTFTWPAWFTSKSEIRLREQVFGIGQPPSGPGTSLREQALGINRPPPYLESNLHVLSTENENETLDKIWRHIKRDTIVISISPSFPFRQYLSVWARQPENGYPAAILCNTVDTKTVDYPVCGNFACRDTTPKGFFTPCRMKRVYCKDPISPSVQDMFREHYDPHFKFTDEGRLDLPELTFYVRKGVQPNAYARPSSLPIFSNVDIPDDDMSDDDIPDSPPIKVTYQY